MNATTPNRAWWGTTGIAVDEQRRWEIGPLRIRIAHLAGEWRIRHRSGEDPHEAATVLAEPESVTDANANATDPGEEVLRFARTDDACEIALRPALADRPIVSHPTEPFFVLPGDETRVFVSSPVWLTIGMTSPARALCEFPILRPSDTWVGSTTGAGQAAYASRTFCRLRLEDLPFRPHRAVTVVHVRNLAAQPLRLERITVAVPHLSLYASREGRLWTESIALTRHAEDTRVDLKITNELPAEVDAEHVIAPAREPINANALKRAFDAFF